MKNTLMVAAAAALAMAVAVPATAQVVTVDAFTNSSSGSGVGLNTGLTFTVGQLFSSTASLTDLWRAGALPRWSNADGLVGPLLATGSDESGEAAGTLIGNSFGTWTQDGFTAPYGSLVGKINNSYQILGTSFNGAAWDSGTLSLYYWDSNNSDNSGSINVALAAVPEPATWAMMIGGFGMIGFGMRRRRSAPAKLSIKFS